MELKDVWQQKRKLEVKAKQCRKDARKLTRESNQLSALGLNPHTTRNLQCLCLAQARMRRAEAVCLESEGTKLLAEGHLLWITEIANNYPDVRIEWRVRDSNNMDCYLSTGEFFLDDEPVIEESAPIVSPLVLLESV
jgi:hypothetical protein